MCLLFYCPTSELKKNCLVHRSWKSISIGSGPGLLVVGQKAQTTIYLLCSYSQIQNISKLKTVINYIIVYWVIQYIILCYILAINLIFFVASYQVGSFLEVDHRTQKEVTANQKKCLKSVPLIQSYPANLNIFATLIPEVATVLYDRRMVKTNFCNLEVGTKFILYRFYDFIKSVTYQIIKIILSFRDILFFKSLVMSSR